MPQSTPLDKTYEITYDKNMQVMTVSNARANLYRLVDEVHEQGEPTMLVGKRHNAVLISEEEWRGIQETIYLSSIPGMVESIKAAAKEPLSEGSTELDW